MRVAGSTLEAVREEVLARLSTQYRGVSMDVRLARPRSFRVYLTGEVRALGPTETNGTQRAADVLLPHILSYGASSRRIEVRHHDGTVELADLDLFLQIGDDSFNPWLRDGDVIQVPTATEFVWAQGAMARPGRYELGVRDSLRTLLRLAGDPLPAAELGRVLLIRFQNAFLPESIWFNLEDVYARRFNPPLEDGERCYVYFVPQYHQQHEVAVVGGFQSSADLSAIRLHRRSPATGEKDPELDRLLRLSRNDLTATEYEILRTKLAGLREVYRVDWARLQSDKDLDLLLRHGDTVRVERLLSSIRVDGEVRRPGIITYVPGQSLSDCVRQVGGYTERAWRGKVRVTRAVTGQTLLARGVRSLDPGDFVWVPEKPDVTVWQQARDVLTSLAQVATIIIAIRSLR
jgi:protein involved in polysaccharide export with SLBB domain